MRANFWKYIAGSLVVGSTLYGLLKYFGGSICNCPARLDGLYVIITGGNSGIGKALAIELANRGANLILACRDVAKGLEAKIEIVRETSTSNSEIHVKHLDLCSFKSVTQFADNVKSQFPEVYALVNCAGVFYHPQVLTEDGFDTTFQTNYLGAFFLSHLLGPHLAKQVHSRIINVSSEAHRRVNWYDLKAITFCQSESRPHYLAYGVSKLALLLFTKEYAKRLAATNVIINAVDPGTADTPLYRHLPHLAVQKPVKLLTAKSATLGCQTVLHALLTSNRTTGQYYRDCKLSLASPIASNDKVAKLYYELTYQLFREQWQVVPLEPPDESEC